MIGIDVMITAHAQEYLQMGKLSLQRGNLGELMLIDVENLIEAMRLIVLAMYTQISVYQV